MLDDKDEFGRRTYLETLSADDLLASMRGVIKEVYVKLINSHDRHQPWHKTLQAIIRRNQDALDRALDEKVWSKTC